MSNEGASGAGISKEEVTPESGVGKEEVKEEVLALPPTSGDVEANAEQKIRSLKVGETLDFAELGPIIINSDGTTRRISNWDSMTKAEQDKTWERISKRNAKRIEQLKKEQE
ncbi:hypothetical protein TrLO_g15750 [Triparma laevis f. longispina]|uniref:Uncharacterized protein n=1 Tax=Triparma laevis f. longispina TaxID=1714387 RepID=A0A9W7EJS3_9STRA|nr:hypothetical protein TrLO_g15750 [Triparma laevis f. longispina]